MLATALAVLHYGLTIFVTGRVLLRRRLAPSARVAWVLIVLSLPVVGILGYLLVGEVRLREADRRRRDAVRRTLSHMFAPSPQTVHAPDAQAAPVIAAGRVAGGMLPVAGNRLTLLEEDDRAMGRLVSAIDGARRDLHILFYIWLPDASGHAVAEAVVRAARRGIACRIIVDAVGSRLLVRSPLWARMQAAGAECATAFPTRNPLLALTRRLDLRNHRKIVVVDDRVAFTGSRNCADMAFAIKPRYAPWIDVWFRVEGPLVRQLQAVFLQDWMTLTGLDLGEQLEMVAPVAEPGQVAQVIATGPDLSYGNLSDVLSTLIHAARERVVITTPYYVPDEALNAAIRSAARRGVAVTMILPARNDSRVVAAASEGFYADLLAAGVRLMLFRGGLVHAKIVTVDGALTLAGSANLDRRSFELNYEVSFFVADAGFTARMDERQASYIERSRRLTLAEVENWSRLRRMSSNLFAIAAPLL